MTRREIEGISGWALIAPLMAELPEEIIKETQKCESPIEQLFASALALIIYSMPVDRRPTLTTQVQIGRFRADIVLVGHFGAPRIVVECDGAAFHQNIKRDVDRTSVIESQGYRVFRASGSEIHHNPLMRARVLLLEVGILP